MLTSATTRIGILCLAFTMPLLAIGVPLPYAVPSALLPAFFAGLRWAQVAAGTAHPLSQPPSVTRPRISISVDPNDCPLCHGAGSVYLGGGRSSFCKSAWHK
jgi:hypothetical protein